jgi:uncharacterized membrane protein YjgN (DUF898 family)
LVVRLSAGGNRGIPMNIAPSVGALPPSLRMTFTGKESDLFQVLLRGSLLQIPTAGFYRFWLMTDVRRHLWAHTEVGDDSFEYTGRGKELLIGFLIALAVIVPLNIVYFVITLEAERFVPFASIPLFVLIYSFGYYAVFRARRYRATRTVFRGVRFWMTGSGWAFLARAALWDFLTLITLGFAYAWRSAALERYKMRHTHYGNLQGSFTASGWILAKRGAWIWAIFLFVAVMAGVTGVRQDWVSMGVLIFALLVGGVFLLPVFKAIELRWWLEGIGFGPVSAQSDLTVGAILKCYFKTIGFWIVYSFVGGMAISLVIGIGISIGRLFTGPITDSKQVLQHLPLVIVGGVVGGLIYIAFLLGFSLIRRLFYDRGVWAAAISSVTLSNLGALDHVVAAGGDIPGGLGEGLLDALDLGGGF